jgi:hypothetical protein
MLVLMTKVNVPGDPVLETLATATFGEEVTDGVPIPDVATSPLNEAESDLLVETVTVPADPVEATPVIDMFGDSATDNVPALPVPLTPVILTNVIGVDCKSAPPGRSTE